MLQIYQLRSTFVSLTLSNRLIIQTSLKLIKSLRLKVIYYLKTILYNLIFGTLRKKNHGKAHKFSLKNLRSHFCILSIIIIIDNFSILIRLLMSDRMSVEQKRKIYFS